MNAGENKKAEIREAIRRIALINAVSHDGKARVGPVIGKLLAENPELKARVKEITDLVKEVVEEVNRIPFNEQKRIVEENWPEALSLIHI